MENNKEIKVGKIPLFKKLWYSVTKFEKYPDMAAEGVGRAIKYLVWLIFMFSLILAIGLIIKFNEVLRKEINYLDENFSEINYENGQLQITPSKDIKSNMGNVIINTDELSEHEIQKYKNSSTQGLKLIWLSDKVIANFNR